MPIFALLMFQQMKKLMYYVVWTICYLVSLLPLWILYRVSDLLYYLLYYGIGYRKKVVRKNLRGAFPEKNDSELMAVEKKFYSFFCDYIVETLKMFSMSDRQMKKRMQFEGVAEMVDAVKWEGKNFGFIYLGHYGNWEWVSSLTARIHDEDPDVIGGHIYHPLANKVIDRIFLKIRGKGGGVNIPMKETLRHVVIWKKESRRTIIGFISDQTPKWSSIHHWTDFFHRKTPVFIGTERIGKQVDALIFYGDVERVRRGYYRCRLTRMVEDVREYPDFEITDRYVQLLEQTIRKEPAYWLWSHNRWKRTYEEYEKRKADGLSER